ncbi:MAG: prolipoprotein diacylglyceryl transferase [Legionellaceae bacterium]|nr:prolipoprotein diacylglyceryl transferase [Legionellaceae bacterium]
MITYPSFDPIAFSIGPIAVHWYGIMYLLGFLMAWGIAQWRVSRYQLLWTSEEIGDLIFYSAVGVIVGGRLGYLLFYDTSQLWTHPLDIFKIWQGGMSFHGGFLGVIVAVYLFAKKFKKPFWNVADFLIPLVPLGLAAGRMGNFINGELWGRVTNVPWAMVFPRGGLNPRHPSQLYEFGLEGLLLFFFIWWYASKPRPNGSVTAAFFMSYAVVRFFVEFFREPDAQLGFIAFDWLTMGQLLSIPMLIAGIGLYAYAQKNNEITK